MKVDSRFKHVFESRDQARVQEALGYDCGWSSEVNGDPFLPIAVAATTTDRLEMGTAIALAFARSPMAVAYTADGLQALSSGRFKLGLGSQVKAHISRRFSMPWSDPVPRMREFVLALHAIWSAWHNGTDLSFEGAYYQHTLMAPNFIPPRHEYGHPPVLMAGVGEAMTRVAGEVADGFICHSFTTDRWLRELTIPALRSGLLRSGRPKTTFDLLVTPMLVVTGNGDAGLPAARQQIAFYASTPSYRHVLALHGWSEVGERLAVLAKKGKWGDMTALVSDEMLEAFAVVGSLTELPQRLSERYSDTASRISLHPPAGMRPEAESQLIRDVKACFQGDHAGVQALVDDAPTDLTGPSSSLLGR